MALRTVRRSASTPRRWPSKRGSLRLAAQRPLPSMMMATWRGAFSRAGAGDPVIAPPASRFSPSLIETPDCPGLKLMRD
jgi:hypothetical protein